MDILAQYKQAREKLLARKADLEAELKQIEAALGDQAPAERLPIDRHQSLREIICELTRARPLTKEEIYDGAIKSGYRFTGKDPMNTLKALLYSKRRGQFRKVGSGAEARFSAA